jgi:ATP-dependent 26S proteasome regulatory subunit
MRWYRGGSWGQRLSALRKHEAKPETAPSLTRTCICCRVMIPLPDAENRERILRVVLEKEEIGSDIDYKELADATEGYSGSDLKVSFLLAEVSVLFEETVVVDLK